MFRLLMFAGALKLLSGLFKKGTSFGTPPNRFDTIKDPEQLSSPDLPGSFANMQASTMNMLYKAQRFLKLYLKFNSGVRSQTHNTDVGGVPGSSHVFYYGVDIDTRGEDKNAIADALFLAGFRRFGFGINAIHVDNDPNKPTPALWYFNNGSISPDTYIYKLVNGT